MLLARGLSVREIAAQLGVSQTAGHKHVRNAVEKLGTRGRLHVGGLAVQAGAS